MSITLDARPHRSTGRLPVIALGAVLLVWLAITAGVVGLLVAFYLPGHAGLTSTLQEMNSFVASNPTAWAAAGGP